MRPVPATIDKLAQRSHASGLVNQQQLQAQRRSCINLAPVKISGYEDCGGAVNFVGHTNPPDTGQQLRAFG